MPRPPRHGLSFPPADFFLYCTVLSSTAFAAIDFESAGLRPGSTEVPVQIGIAGMQGLHIDPADAYGSFLSTDQPITWSAQKVHGITTAHLLGAPALTDLWPEVKKRLQGRWIVAHGAATEKRFLRAFPFHGFGPWVDTLKLSRALWPTLPSFALGDLVASLGLEDALREVYPGFRWHDALSDALASLIVLRKVIQEAGIAGEPAEILLRPNDSYYHRLKKR